jgi:putative ABC transport system permease protein
VFRNCLIAGLRHLARNRLYAIVSIGGLSVGLCVALLAALILRNQYSYDHFVPGYDRTYALIAELRNPGLRTEYRTLTQVRLAAPLALAYPQIEAVTRAVDQAVRVRHGRQSARETVYWVDANFFDALPLKVLAGDVRTALRSPDGVVLSRSYARKYFGQDAPLGETLEVGAGAMVVRAIIEDMPPNGTHLQRDILAAGIASNSRTTQSERDPANQGDQLQWIHGLTYVRLKPGASIEALRAAMPAFLERTWPRANGFSVRFVRIDRLNTFEPMNPGFGSRMTMFGILGAVVLLIAGANFVNLLTTRSVRRAREVAIRKLAGAGRGTLIAQFLGETLLHALVAAVLALAMTEWLLPYVNAFLDAGATLDYVREPGFVLALLAVAIALGTLAGSYPAFVVSAFRPAPVLRAGSAGVGSSPRLRRALVTLQFALLISLAICAGIVQRQRSFATNEALRLDADQVLLVMIGRESALIDELRKLPGVLSATRTGLHFLGTRGFRSFGAMSIGGIPVPGRGEVRVNWSPLDYDVFDFYGVQPLAGELPKTGSPATRRFSPDSIVLNETAARRLGITDFKAAIGSTLPGAGPPMPDYVRDAAAAPTPRPPSDAVIAAVVPDFSLDSVEEVIPPVVYYQSSAEMGLVHLRLKGREIPETLKAIDALWIRTASGASGVPEPPLRFFLDELVQGHYLTMLRQAQTFGIAAGIALLLACVGLFALTAATAERCTREIGIRKALGAQTATIVRLLLWQFATPVLWALLIAWPVSYWVMHRWLEGFAYRTTIPWWLVPITIGVALAIATSTVIAQAVRVARTRPVEALRHE